MAVVVGLALAPSLLGLLARAEAPRSGIPVSLSAHDLWTTTWAVGAIVLIATLIGWPVGWRASRLAPGRGLVLLLPLLLPSYLAYAGWGTLRAPGTWLGDLLLRGFAGGGAPVSPSGPSGAPAVTAATNMLPILASRLTAIVGLSLWGWPIVAAVVGAGARAFPSGALDALRADGATARARTFVVMCATWHLALLGALLLALVVAGSAVPLHVAQLDTLAIRAWRWLDELPPGEHWRVWRACWPLLLVAGVGSVGVWRAARARGGSDGGHAEGGGSGAGLGVLGWSALGASVLAPAVLAAWSLKSASSLRRVWLVAWGPAWTSAAVAAAVGAMAAALAALTWRALERGGPGARAARVAMLVAVAAALVPGVLIGSSAARGWSLVPEWVADSWLPVVLAHAARFGAIGVVAGWWLWATEARELRDVRALEVGGGWRAWWLGTGRWGDILAAGIVVALLSLHEIESAVMLRPASSSGGGLAWLMLQWLHFARLEDLSAGMLWMFGVGVAGAAASGWLLGRNRGAAIP